MAVQVIGRTWKQGSRSQSQVGLSTSQQVNKGLHAGAILYVRLESANVSDPEKIQSNGQVLPPWRCNCC